MARWCCGGAASAFLNAEKKFHGVSGYRELWMLENALKTLLIDINQWPSLPAKRGQLRLGINPPPENFN